MRRHDDRCTLDPGRTALALRGMSPPASYPFVERHLWRKRAVGLFVVAEGRPIGVLVVREVNRSHLEKVTK
jgi:hypothetical protein